MCLCLCIYFLQTSLRELFTAEESPRLESIEDITKQSDNNLSQKQVEEVMYMYIIHICIYTCTYKALYLHNTRKCTYLYIIQWGIVHVNIIIHIKYCTCTIHEHIHVFIVRCCTGKYNNYTHKVLYLYNTWTYTHVHTCIYMVKYWTCTYSKVLNMYMYIYIIIIIHINFIKYCTCTIHEHILCTCIYSEVLYIYLPFNLLKFSTHFLC